MKKTGENSITRPRWEIKQINERTLLLSVVLIGVLVLFSLVDRRFLTIRSITSIAFQCPEIGLMGLGMALAMTVGGVNLAINDTAMLSALMAGLFLLNLAPLLSGYALLSVGLAIGIALITGTLCGLLNGLLIGYVRVPPILVTLATLLFFRGISVAITGGRSLAGFPGELSVIGHGTVLGIPISFLIFLGVGALVYLTMEKTVFGFSMRMVGTNYQASRFSGIRNQLVILKTHALSGLLGAVAGIIIMSRTNSVAYEYGTKTYILLTLIISVLGGTSPGFANVIGILQATVILQILSTGFHMVLLGVRGSSFFKDFSWGAIFIGLLIADYSLRKWRERVK